MNRQQLAAAIAAQEALRATVGDDVVDATVAMLRAQLPAIDDETRRRRQVTVLFADVSGFTAMSESMDAEEVAEVMNDLWAQLDEVVVGHGGRIDKHIGDALMAIWGADATSEDDPEQAVRAALGLQDALARSRRDSGLSLAMRVGVNTGPVLLGAVGSTAEFTAMGDAVNVASRLEHACPRDGVLISHHTYQHVRGVFDVETMPPLTVKGKAELVTVYLVRAVKTRAFRRPSRGVEGVETRMIGRDAELARLCAAFDVVADAPTARAVTIVGDAGVGKSRLLWEFDNWIELHPRAIFYLKGRAVQQRHGTPLALIHDLVATRFEIADSDSSEVVLAKLVEGAAAALRPNEAMTLGAWLGFDLGASAPSIEGDALAVAARTYFVEFLRGLAREAPVVMLLEDVHWADDESLDLVERLTGFIGALPVLVVAAARPSLYERRAEWGDTADCETIRLDALGAVATRLLVAEILRLADHVPDELVELILDRSDGNAFYVEELVKMFIDDGVIDTSSQAPQWNVDTARVDAARVPATLTGVLQARLDALPSRARASLQHASVVGRVFWDSAVDALSDGHHDLASLHQRELIFPRHPSAFRSASEYIFKHALLRDVVYESVLLSERPVLHKRTAEWLEQIAVDRRDEYLVEIATHRRAAGQTAAAAEMLVAAAKLAVRAGALRSASALAEQAVELWERDGVEPPAGALVVLAGVRRALGRYAESRVVAQRALVAARAIGDTDAELGAAHIAARIAEELGDNGEASDVLAASLPTAERSGGAALAEMLGHFALTDLRSRRSGDALALAQRGLQIAHASGHLDTIASVTRRLTSIAYELGDVDLAATYAEAAVAASRGTGDLEGEAMALSNFGAARYVQGEVRDDPNYFLDSKRQYEAAVDIGRRLGSPELIATVLANLAEVTVRLGDPAGAAGLAHEGMGLAFGVGAIPATLIALVAHAEALIAMGDRATGMALLGLADRQGFAIGSTEVARIVDQLRQAGAHDIDDGLAAGAALDFDTEVRAILASSPRPGPTRTEEHHTAPQGTDHRPTAAKSTEGDVK